MFGPIEAVIFDLDGTLVDTMPSVIKGLQGAVEFGTGNKVSLEDLIASFGPAPIDILRKWMPEERVPAAFAHWRNFEMGIGPEAFVPFAGTDELLRDLAAKKVPVGIFTGRDRAGAIRILKRHGWLGRFFEESTIVCGDDGFAAKPKPDSLVHLLKLMNLTPATTLMVGDHPYDILAGQAAGTKTAAALWDLPLGQRSKRASFKAAWQKWDSVPCDLRLESPLSLLEWFKAKKT